MKIAFIFSSLNISSPMGVMYLSSALKKAGHQTEIICFEKENLFKKLQEIKPNILAYSLTTGTHKQYLSINKKIKKHFNIFSIFGGPHATFYPEIIEEEGVDAICRGEGEEAFVEFVNKLEQGKSINKVKNFWIKKKDKILKNPVRNLIQNLDELPFPDRDLIYKKEEFFKNLGMKRFMVGRGCPFKCTYCFNGKYNKIYEGKGKIIRQRSVENVIKEIKDVKEKYPLKLVKFIDDTFNLNKEWLQKFSEKYKKEIDLPFICNLRADLITSEVVNNLKKANCIAAYIGIETGNEKRRKEILNRNMSNKQILNACFLLRKKKIKIVTQNMLGLPGEKIEDSFETILFNSKCKVTLPGFSIFQPYPETTLTNYSIEKGFFDGNFNKLSSNYLEGTVLNYTPEEKNQLENLFKLSTFVAKFPIFKRLIKKMIKLKKNKSYSIFQGFFYGLSEWQIYSTIISSPKDIKPIFKKLFGFLYHT